MKLENVVAGVALICLGGYGVVTGTVRGAIFIEESRYLMGGPAILLGIYWLYLGIRGRE